MTSLTPVKDPTRLAPEDAYLKRSSDDLSPSLRTAAVHRLTQDQQRNRSRSKRRKGPWKKLLWVKQSYPDNYTDEDTFLDALQRNPRLIPYEFWPLVADSTVIVQQVCTVVVFASCFVGIVQERVSPVNVVRWSTAVTVLGWLLWDVWVGQLQASEVKEGRLNPDLAGSDSTTHDSEDTSPSISQSTGVFRTSNSEPSEPLKPAHSAAEWAAPPRTQQLLATAKSALLIYFVLLGLSPILKSLTESTSSDSIWAISFWLLCINVIFFDYSSGVIGATFPASLSTNAALMASTVLASRLPSTTHAFSLTLFSIQVFGLFPIFRRYLRRASRRAHFVLTWLLVMGAGGGAGISFTGGGWLAAIAGSVLGCVLTGLGMGLCSWWLIGLQRYKNEIRGPWDAARPVIRRFD